MRETAKAAEVLMSTQLKQSVNEARLPLGSQERSKPTQRLVIATPRMFGARRAEQRPGRARSPRNQLHCFS
jgi:hypothetical protein